MTRLRVNAEALFSNIRLISDWIGRHGGEWTLVAKVLCGDDAVIRLLVENGIGSIGDTRILNLKTVHALNPGIETWFLRPPHLSGLESIVELADVSLNSEIAAIEGLSRSAVKLGKTHRIVIMIELGDLREGILPGSLTRFYERVFELPAIEVIGIGSNIGCLSGSAPTVDQLMQLVLYRELLELKFGRPLPLISAGTTVTLPFLLSGRIPKTINHFRIGEGVFLGTDLLNGGILDGLRSDVFTLEAEVCELKEKSLLPMADVAGIAPFDAISSQNPSPGQTALRAIINIGQLDTDVSGLVPLDPGHVISGASSDLTVVDVSASARKVLIGGTISLRPSYAALLRLMSTRYIPTTIDPLSSDHPARHPDLIH